MKNIFQVFFSTNPKLAKVKQIIDEIAKTDITVLINGESGTGKGIVAHAIHLNSDRTEKPFIKINCASIPEGLLESELFGFERGAFTGAHMKKPGKFELANGGTILLNDIGEMDISMQAKLLQVLQDGEFSRLGGEGTISVNTRVVSTTKDDLERSMLEGRFRSDLFYRINVVPLNIPPLRECREQIAPLCSYYFEHYSTKYGRTIPSLSKEALRAFDRYQWPGNIRELENLVKRIVLFGDEREVVRTLLDDEPERELPGRPENLLPSSSSEPDSLDLKKVGRRAAEIAERTMIQATLQETHWNRKSAARLLKVSYKALLNKIQKYRLAELETLETIKE